MITEFLINMCFFGVFMAGIVTVWFIFGCVLSCILSLRKPKAKRSV